MDEVENRWSFFPRRPGRGRRGESCRVDARQGQARRLADAGVAVLLRCLEGRGLLRMSESALRESLGAAIRERRKGLGLTLAQMAQRTGVSLGYLSQIELGKNSASIETLYRISLGLGLRMSDLFQSVASRKSEMTMTCPRRACTRSRLRNASTRSTRPVTPGSGRARS